jgi:superfamily II DNA or RNA helicase
MIATPVFKEGINIPEIKTLILAGGGKSHIAIIQKIGRGLRKAEGKDRLIVYDFLDDCSKVTLKHSEQRYKLYRAEGFEVTLEME